MEVEGDETHCSIATSPSTSVSCWLILTGYMVPDALVLNPGLISCVIVQCHLDACCISNAPSICDVDLSCVPVCFEKQYFVYVIYRSFTHRRQLDIHNFSWLFQFFCFFCVSWDLAICLLYQCMKSSVTRVLCIYHTLTALKGAHRNKTFFTII